YFPRKFLAAGISIIMSAMLKKRSREDEPLLNSSKRFHGETQQQSLHFFEDIVFVDEIQQEEAISGVIRSLGEEIGVSSCSTFYRDFSEISSDGSVASDMISAFGTTDGVIDLDYLLGASDDDLGIPPSPIATVDGQAEETSSLKEKGCDSSLDFAQSAEIKGFTENWQFEDIFLDYSQFAVYEDTVSDVVNLEAFFDGDYSASSSWDLETACVMRDNFSGEYS
ncbi:hypothetical protein KI387_027601, partial [Taxus chinensis]